MLDETTLIRRCREGDDLAWEALVRTYQARVYGLAYHYLRHAEEAREAAQEIFVRIYQALPSFQEGGRLVAWIMRISRNHCIDAIRARRARPESAELPADESAALVSTDPGPDERTEEGARRRTLYRALDRVSERNREILLLKEIQGLKLEEIATMLRLPIGTVKSRSNRARLELAAKVLELDPSYGT